MKCNEPNSRQTVYSSFLIWFTDSSSGISSTIKTKQNKNILYQNEKSKIEKHERDGATKLTSKKNKLCNEARHINKCNEAELNWTQ